MSTDGLDPDSPLHPYWDAPDKSGGWDRYSQDEVSRATQRTLALIRSDERCILHLSGALALAMLGRFQALDALAGAHAGVRDFLTLATYQAQQIIPAADNEGKPDH